MQLSRKETVLHEGDMVTIGEAAEEFNVPRIKIYRWLKAGRLAAYRSGRDERAKLVRRSDVAALLEPEPVEFGAPEVKSAA